MFARLRLEKSAVPFIDGEVRDTYLFRDHSKCLALVQPPLYERPALFISEAALFIAFCWPSEVLEPPVVQRCWRYSKALGEFDI